MTALFRTVAGGLAVVSVGLGLMPVAAQAAARSDPTKPGASAAPASAGKKAGSTAAPASPNVPLLPGAGSKEPVNIDAGQLDYFDKEQKLVYTGDVVAVQGDSTLKASVLTIFLQKQDAANPGGATAPAQAPAAPGAPAAGSSVKHMEAEGPVTLISKDQIGTGDHATYDKAENKVYLNSNVTLTQGTNVTQGDRLIYDLTTGQAQVFSGDTNPRVTSVFTPGSAPPGGPPDDAKAGAKKEEPAATKRKTAAGGKTTAGGKSAASGKATSTGGPAATAEQ